LLIYFPPFFFVVFAGVFFTVFFLDGVAFFSEDFFGAVVVFFLVFGFSVSSFLGLGFGVGFFSVFSKESRWSRKEDVKQNCVIDFCIENQKSLFGSFACLLFIRISSFKYSTRT